MESKQTTIWAVLVITFALATVCLALRLFSRYLKKMPLWWDDYFAIAGYFLAISWLVACPFWIQRGLGLHVQDVTWMTLEEAIVQSKLLLFIAEIVYAWALYCAKMSILCFYWRIFNVTTLRVPIIILVVLTVCWIIVRTIMGIFHCIPVQAFWHWKIEGARCDVDEKLFFFFSVLVHLLIDLAIVSLPVFQIRQLQLRTMEKLGVIALFVFGSTVCVCAVAIIIAAGSFDMHSPDVTWNFTNVVIWATAEINLVTVSACFPSIKPAVSFFFGRWIPRSILGYSTNSHDRQSGYSRSQKSKHTIALSRIGRSRNRDDADSTNELAQDASVDTTSEDNDTRNFDPRKGVMQTIISGRNSDDGVAEEGRIPGICVRTEAYVRISEIREGAPSVATSSKGFA